MIFKPDAIYFEPDIENYVLGRELLQKYEDIPKFAIENHNNIPQMRSQSNAAFPKMKKHLIMATRKTHKYTENHKVSDYLVPYTSSGCTAMCLYCYLVCHYNKCAYLRLFVNREQMLDKITKTAEKSEKELIFEIGSNSDLILENSITNNLVWTIENFAKSKKGFLTFPTKFDMVDPILDVEGKEKIIVRMSVNPEELIDKIELGTSPLKNRIQAINKLCRAGYRVGILIAPIILVEHWEAYYKELILTLDELLEPCAKSSVFFELIFMTYSYIHKMINSEAFPRAMNLYNPELMTVRGRGKYCYKKEVRDEAEKILLELLHLYFPKNKIWYVS